ncbi:hypothetical protein QEJ31_11785 [Pigmentibacter sp. JX0631]|uniref:hypothetical protein n=1 Tax=Pigmentibacter sp. JX0631 TaxID=2976982 RepID=UPI002469C0F4|nr:hypothetical protein [Pigmentibacter sp. JX0631]WGL59202.1 hypothetical protein QEJ31_11785 [Pigmentibacter sp. JX0631]
MNLLQSISKQLSYSEKELISQYLRQVLEYNGIEFDEKLFFSSTSIFNIKMNDGNLLKQKFPLKILIPDFILENFSHHSRDQKNIIINFIKIFIKEILYLNYYVELNKKNLIYNYSIKNDEKQLKFCSRRDVVIFLRRYFISEPQFIEGCPKKIKNNKQFKLGEDRISARLINKSPTLGGYFYSFVNKFAVSIEVFDFELNALEKLLSQLQLTKYIFISSGKNQVVNRSRLIKLLFENNKCVHVYTLPKLLEL